MPEPPSTPVLHRRVVRAAMALALMGVTAVGFVLPLGHLVADPHALRGDRLVYLMVCFAFAAVVTNTSMSLAFGATTTEFVPDEQPVLLASMVGGPVVGGLVGFASLFDVGHVRSVSHPWKLVPAVGVNAAAATAAGWVAGVIDPGASDPLLLLPGAVAATVAFQVVMVAGFFLQFELVHRSGRAFLASIHRMIGFTSALNCFGLALVLPYRDHPSVAVGLLAAFQGATFVVAKLSTSESLAVRRTAYLSETFSRYVPDSVARKLAEEGTAIQLGGEERDITVLFCDVRGFTAWSETVPAEQVVGELNVLLGELSHAVMEHGGTLDKFTGDGLMAFWGAPLDQPDHAALACDAAHDMAVRLDRVNAVRAGVGQPPFAIGIGINSGPAVVGNVGSEQRLDYTAIGDTVNLAARLEATTKDLGSTVVCSTSTRDHLPADRQPEFASLGFVRVKGKREPVAVHALATVHAPVDVPAA